MTLCQRESVCVDDHLIFKNDDSNLLYKNRSLYNSDNEV